MHSVEEKVFLTVTVNVDILRAVDRCRWQIVEVLLAAQLYLLEVVKIAANLEAERIDTAQADPRYLLERNLRVLALELKANAHALDDAGVLIPDADTGGLLLERQRATADKLGAIIPAVKHNTNSFAVVLAEARHGLKALVPAAPDVESCHRTTRRGLRRLEGQN